MPQPVRDRPTIGWRHQPIRRTGLFRRGLVVGCLVGCWTFCAVSVWAQDPGPPAAVATAPSPPAEISPDQNVAPLMAENPIPTKNLLQVIRDGGPMMVPIAVCSVLLLVFAFERAVSLRRGRVIPGPFVQRFLSQLKENQLDRDTAWELCQENRSPVSEVFAAAVKKWGRPSVEIEQSVIDAGERVSTGLRKYLRAVNGICTISPMLGLLGTVLGMISSFNSIATSDAMGRPDRLASGIGEALLTTAAGLCVAIPAMVVYMVFVSRVDQLIIEMDALSQQVIEQIASDTWHRDNDEEEKPKRRLKAA